MKRLLACGVMALFMFACNAQNSEPQKENKKNTPNESWTVNKEMDENGNIIRYDSTYTWSYSNIEGDSVNVNVDSLMQSFQQYFDDRMPSLFGENFMRPLLGDSLLRNDFFDDDFFRRRFEDDFFDVEKMFERMDSIRNQFFKEKFPDMEQKLSKEI